MLNRRRQTQVRESRRRFKLAGGVVLMALVIGALGAYSFAQQSGAQPGPLPLTPSAMIRTTPDAPHEVPPPVAPTK